jgi:CubicO group peptidase (beta-lactamase class C family)
MADISGLRGTVLLQRGSEDLVASAAGATGSGGGCSLGTRFQISSISKQFTAVAVLLLADRGVLSVDDPVSRWLDGCPAAWKPITVHHLLSHSSGLVHWRGVPGLDLTKPVVGDEMLRIFADFPLLSPPGERFSYSSPGWVLLGLIIEQAAGLAYGEFVAREIFEPLGMTATFSGNSDGQPDLAAGHHGGRPVPSWDLDASCLGTGSIWSTVGDLAGWDRALARGELLSRAAREAMLTAQVPAAGDGAGIHAEGYGYGWYTGHAAGHRIFYHSGDNPGYLGFNAWFPDHGVRLAVLSNDETTPLEQILHDLIRTAFP